MENEAFTKLMNKFYSDTFTVEYSGETFEFQKRLASETSVKMNGLKKAEQSQYLVAVLSKNPKFSLEQVIKLPNDLINKVVFTFNQQSELSGEQMAALQKAADDS